MALNDLNTAASRTPGNMCFSSGAVAAGTNAGTMKTTATITFAVDGRFYSKAATDNVALAAPTSAQLPGDFEKYRLYSIGSADPARTFYMVFALATDGSIVTFQGTFAGQDLSFRGGAVSKGDGLIPQIPEGQGLVPFAIAKIENPVNLAFTPGTTALTTASGRTVTFYNVAALPAVTTL